MKFFSLKYTELIVTVDAKTTVVESGVRMTKGMNGVFPQGLSIAFQKREFDTKSLRLGPPKEAQLIKILKAHPGYGVSFIAEDTSDADPEVQENRSLVQDKEVAAAKAADTDHNEPINKKK